MRISVEAVTGLGEIRAGADLGALLAPHVAEGDILVVTSKIVSKAEGRVRTVDAGYDRERAIDDETDRLVARRGPTRIVRNRLGLTMAAAGVDASNTEAGTVVLLPHDPDASARALREALATTPGVNVAVLVSDTAGRAWRHGQTDLAIGAAGMAVLEDFSGRVDAYGHELQVTAPALADEMAAAGDLVKGKLSGSPVAVVRGLAALVLPRGEHGPGAAVLVRGEDEDMFGLGAREAVVHAVLLDETRGFGATTSLTEVAQALSLVASVTVEDGHVVAETTGTEREAGRQEARIAALAHAHGWVAGPAGPGRLVIRPRR